jgi:hypothetical protein
MTSHGRQQPLRTVTTPTDGTMFIRLGQRRGLIAMQRIRKGGLSSLLA